MNDDEIREIAEKIDRVPLGSTEPKVYMTQYCGDYQGPQSPIKVLANRAGYLKLASRFLLAAIESPIKPDSRNLPSRPSDFYAEDSIAFSLFQRSEEGIEYPALQSEKQPSLLKETLAKIIGVALVLFLLASLLVGAVTIFGFIGRTLASPSLPK